MKLEEIYKKALSFHTSGKMLEAEQAYKEVLNLFPEQTFIYGNLADTLVQQNKVLEAEQVLEKGVNEAPQNAQMMVMLSNLKARMGKVEEGLKLSLRAIEIQPNSPEMFYNLGNIQALSQKLEDACISYRKAISLNPDMGNAWYNLGNALHGLGETKKAIEAFRTSCEKAPGLLPAYINLGNLLTEVTNYEEAQSFYEKAIQIDLNSVPAYKGLGMLFHVTGELAKAEQHYRLALQKGGEQVEVLTLLGNVHRDQGLEKEAIDFFNKVLALDPSHEIALQNVRKLQKQRISSWHFEMLADTARNEAYDTALKNAVKEGMHVLDIGTGSGLLSMMAVRAGAQKVTACEFVPTLAEVANQVVKDNNMEAKIKIWNKKSTSLKVGKELSGKADLLVSEILDAGLLGEGVIPSHRHAVENLLKKDGVVIPQSADFQCVLIESEHLRSINPLSSISGFDLKAFDDFRVPGEYQRVLLNITPHRFLSEVFSFGAIDFKHLPPAASTANPNVRTLSIKTTEEGVVHGIAFWFDLHLDAQTQLSSGPDGEMIHWGQAVYIFEDSLKVDSGTELSIKMYQSDALIQFDYSI